MGIQSLLAEPNELSPAQEAAYFCFVNKKSDYQRRVRAQAQAYVPK